MPDYTVLLALFVAISWTIPHVTAFTSIHSPSLKLFSTRVMSSSSHTPLHEENEDYKNTKRPRYCISSFPTLPLSQGRLLIHMPEAWAQGGSLALGVARFNITAVYPPVKIHKDNMVTVKINPTTHIAIISKGPNRVYIKLSDQVMLHMKVMPLEKMPLGFSLFIELMAQDTAISAQWSCSMRQALETLVLGLIGNITEIEQNPVLQAWRHTILP